MKIETKRENGLLLVTVTVPRYDKSSPDENETNTVIKIGSSDLKRKFPQFAKLVLKEGKTLDNRVDTTATWVFYSPEPPPLPAKPKTTTRRKRTRKTTKKTETEV
jgi:hypothetical protein